jgi:hypothetical protein
MMQLRNTGPKNDKHFGERIRNDLDVRAYQIEKRLSPK